ncbi:unnamed protein product [Linum trigynum]|uniref:Uncharacterized protein n=1 Tax=Linum trigynum TaxID=586398 RepID=A0AAV2E8Y4_9ROSI
MAAGAVYRGRSGGDSGRGRAAGTADAAEVGVAVGMGEEEGDAAAATSAKEGEEGKKEVNGCEVGMG